jgi:hypothetical protein
MQPRRKITALFLAKGMFTKVSLLLLFIMAHGCKKKNTEEAVEKPNSIEEYTVSGANVLAFGPANILFIGDSKSAKLTAVEVSAETLEEPVPYNMEGIDQILAERTAMNPRDLIVQDMKVHPRSQEVYIALRLGHDPEAKSVIAVVNPLKSSIDFLKLTKENSSSTVIKNPASADLVFWKETPASSLTITDIDFNEGYVYIAGLTNSEFASSLRKIKYPFEGSQESVEKIEIYHAVHTQLETRAPIRTMLFDELNGESTLIASYTCTPLVTIPTGEIEEKASITGKTIAELGYGNTPIDMLMVTSQGFDGSVTKSLLVTNKNRGGTMIPFQSVEKGAAGKGMFGERALFASGLEGIQEIPTANVMQIDVQNKQMLGILRRNIETGSIDLVSELTGTFLRLSDFISEYDFPDYRYPESQQMTKQYHDMVKKMEGYPELTSENSGR